MENPTQASEVPPSGAAKFAGPRWVYDDGGRKATGFAALDAGDCVTRAIAIATGQPYRKVYDAINSVAELERPGARAGRQRGKRSSARNGVFKPTIRRYMETLGWRWVPTMQIGSGCKVHLRADELPKGRIIASVSKHCVAVIDGVIHDTFDPSREGNRCVYGYFTDAVGDRDHAPASAAGA